MYYHVRIKTKSRPSRGEVKLDLSEEQLYSRFIKPYENYYPIVINGKTITPKDIYQILISKTEEDSSRILPVVKAEREVKKIQPRVSYQWSVASKGKDITDELIRGPPGYKKQKIQRKKTEMRPQSNQIFVVHGHDEEMKQAVARTLEKLDLTPIILHEQPNQGRTIIEKFTDYADSVSFAVVLLSPDDKGYKKDQSSDVAKFRARQNVILELGFFIGKLGRNNVAALFKNEPEFERPSDYDGVLYTPFDDAGNWRFDLVRELKSSGYDVDANRLLS